MKKVILFLMLTVAAGYLFAQNNPASYQPKQDTALVKPGRYHAGRLSTVNELLKTMNGFEIGDDGTVFHNGQQINIAKINGKSYIGVNIAKALKGLPADAVKNIEVIADDQAVRKGAVQSGNPQEILSVIINEDRDFNAPGYAGIQRYRRGDRYLPNDAYNYRYGEPTMTDPRNPSDRYVDRAIINMQAASSSMFEVNEWGDQIPHFVIKEWPGPHSPAKKKNVKDAAVVPASEQKPVQP